uniref:Tryptophan synthase beta chain n=1 Tax=Anthurium amnicola TaxID=1678845 RepID=A0A1D1XHD4_9ARAE
MVHLIRRKSSILYELNLLEIQCQQMISLVSFHIGKQNTQGKLFAGPSSVAVPLVCSSMGTACITTMLDRACQGSCRQPSSSATWLAFAMVSFSCLVVLASVLPCCSSATYIGPSNASSLSMLI